MLTKCRTFGLMLAPLAGLAIFGAACLGGDDDDVEPDNEGGFVPNEDTPQSVSPSDQEPSGQPTAAANAADQQPALVEIR